MRDRETKQVEFVRASGINSEPIYVYDGAQIGNRYYGWGSTTSATTATTARNPIPKVWVMREFVNSETNHLGLPLPKVALRFYRRDADGQMEFTGENTIDHTPRDETIRVYTGNAFDLVGERKQTDFKTRHAAPNGSTNPSRSNCATTKRSRWKSASSNISTAGTTWQITDKVRHLPQDRRADHRVPRPGQAGRGKNRHLHRALFVVKSL